MKKNKKYTVNPNDEKSSIAHLCECDGCFQCDFLLEFFSSCVECGTWKHLEDKSVVVNDSSEFFCSEKCEEKYGN